MENYKDAFEYLLKYTERVLYYVQALESGSLSLEEAREIAKEQGTESAKEIFTLLLNKLKKDFNLTIKE